MQQQMQAQQQLNQLETATKQFMTPEAISRYGNVKAAHPEKAIQSLLIIAQLANENQLPQKVTDFQYKELLQKMTPEQKKFTITRK